MYEQNPYLANTIRKRLTTLRMKAFSGNVQNSLCKHTWRKQIWLHCACALLEEARKIRHHVPVLTYSSVRTKAGFTYTNNSLWRKETLSSCQPLGLWFQDCWSAVSSNPARPHILSFSKNVYPRCLVLIDHGRRLDSVSCDLDMVCLRHTSTDRLA